MYQNTDLSLLWYFTYILSESSHLSRNMEATGGIENLLLHIHIFGRAETIQVIKTVYVVLFKDHRSHFERCFALKAQTSPNFSNSQGRPNFVGNHGHS